MPRPLAEKAKAPASRRSPTALPGGFRRLRSLAEKAKAPASRRSPTALRAVSAGPAPSPNKQKPPHHSAARPPSGRSPQAPPAAFGSAERGCAPTPAPPPAFPFARPAPSPRSSPTPQKPQAYGPHAARPPGGQTGSARFGGAPRRRACGPPPSQTPPSNRPIHRPFPSNFPLPAAFHNLSPFAIFYVKNPPNCKLFVKKCCILTFQMQKTSVLAVLVKGVVSICKNFQPI